MVENSNLRFLQTFYTNLPMLLNVPNLEKIKIDIFVKVENVQFTKHPSAMSSTVMNVILCLFNC